MRRYETIEGRKVITLLNTDNKYQLSQCQCGSSDIDFYNYRAGIFSGSSYFIRCRVCKANTNINFTSIKNTDKESVIQQWNFRLFNEDELIKTKKCPRCKIEKIIQDDFYRVNYGKDYDSVCKDCRIKKIKQRKKHL